MERQDATTRQRLKIYVSHAGSFDYRKELYQPIRQSKLNDLHEFILPHEKNAEPFHAKT